MCTEPLSAEVIWEGSKYIIFCLNAIYWISLSPVTKLSSVFLQIQEAAPPEPSPFLMIMSVKWEILTFSDTHSQLPFHISYLKTSVIMLNSRGNYRVTSFMIEVLVHPITSTVMLGIYFISKPPQIVLFFSPVTLWHMWVHQSSISQLPSWDCSHYVFISLKNLVLVNLT